MPASPNADDIDGVRQASRIFTKHFAGHPTAAAAAPGRVNLIGEHTDYNDGFVFPIALEKNTFVVGKKTNDENCSVACGAFESAVHFPVSVDEKGSEAWANYPKGMVAMYRRHGCKIGGFQAAIWSAVPMGGGVSSSAALEMATGKFLEVLFELKVTDEERAKLGQKCEHEFAGVPCGIMDQLISSKALAGKAMLIDCRSLECTPVPLDMPGIAVVVVNSNVKHELTGSEYSTRRSHCMQAAKIIGEKYPSVKALRDANEDMLNAVTAKLGGADGETFRRAHHVIRENQRTLDGKAALDAGNLNRFGELMKQSHESLRTDYEVSTDEIDALVEIAVSIPGVYGSRITGGGFGGCTVSLVKEEAVPKLLAAIAEQYPSRTKKNLIADCFVTKAGPGARQVQI
eukprot:Plantae.Rhodophyta-Hildenbrandia_rubra.ctg5435.p1 GENE.Plantae.Rhodophyta-Hildenbrandia_rubra.ctg5435~~Plantae.Rhodophyta-Hildenbrandia_rubra.ctg5435.p1  ORF type:complete len:401 (+),score=67.33 Plantae.Rhodophyta-Hildenbrandia_rubra.ctg5435:196-1398(+)